MKKVVKLCAAIGTLAMLVGFNTKTAYADEIISINTPEQLENIGKSADYPLDGDYILTSDIDMSGKTHVPIGNVNEPFTGTFDGDGFAIRNLNIEGTELGKIAALGEESVTGYGIFGVIKNNSGEDKVVISNLNICNVTISDEQSANSVAGTLSAVAYNGVVVKNISVIDIHIELKATKNKILYGAGGLLGIVWTDKENTPRAKTEISDIYTNGLIKASAYEEENTVSGIIGCVYNKGIGSISRVISLGELTYNDESGYGIATSKKYDGNGIADKAVRVYYALEDNRADNGIGNGISKGVLASGKVALSDGWQQSKGMLPVLKQAITHIGLDELIYPSFKRNQLISNMTEDFFLPISYDGKKIEWSSSSKSIVVDNTTGDVKVTFTDGKAEKAKLTYICDGKTGVIDLTVGEQKDICFDKQYVKPEDTLKVLYATDNATYKWEILDKKTNTKRTISNNTSEYVVSDEDLESFI